jgi:L-threonylcarbamoyladenylate synthase
MNVRKTTNIEDVVAVIKDGGVVVFPTETSYGIGCDARNHEAVARVIRLKNRPDDMPVALIVKDLDMALECGDFSEVEYLLADRHWPGPLTLVLHNAKEELPDHCVMNNTVGVRVSSHPVASAIVHGAGAPIVATSANIHGEESAFDVEAAIKQFGHLENGPDLYFDGGSIDQRAASMIIEVIDGEIVVHRKGSFKI